MENYISKAVSLLKSPFGVSMGSSIFAFALFTVYSSGQTAPVVANLTTAELVGPFNTVTGSLTTTVLPTIILVIPTLISIGLVFWLLRKVMAKCGF